MKQLITASLLALVLTACATSFQKPPLTADYGAYPSTYQDLVKSYMKTAFFIDAESASYRFGTPRKAYVNKRLLFGGKVAWTGYAVQFSVKPKDPSSGYTIRGCTDCVALIRDGVINLQEAGDPSLLLNYAE
jgi:hypothetical protein